MRRSSIVWCVIAGALVASCGGRARTTGATSPGQPVPNTSPTGQAAFLGAVHQVRVGHITMGYRTFGHGPDLLMISGQASAMNTWGFELPSRLAKRFRVTMFDNRGVGYSSDDPAVPLSIELMADDTAALMDALGIAKAHIVGWSTGGEIALALAERHPQKVATLVLSGATAGGPTAVQAPPAVDALLSSPDLSAQAELLSRYLFPPGAGAALDAFVNGYLAVPDETVSDAILARQEEAEKRFAKETGVYDGLPHITARTLVTNGALDELVPPANARIIAGRIPGAQLELFPHAAHAMMFQEMDRFVALVESFVLGH